jgi:hypothetical protein
MAQARSALASPSSAELRKEDEEAARNPLRAFPDALQVNPAGRGQGRSHEFLASTTSKSSAATQQAAATDARGAEGAPESVAPLVQPTKRPLSAFIQKLREIVDKKGALLCVWGTDGTSIVVTDTVKFSSEILPLYFRCVWR